MDQILLDAFSAQLEKWAALDEREQAAYKQVVRNQAKFDQMAGAGSMTDAQKELHRQNTERLKHFTQKRRNDAHKIPGWARNPEGRRVSGFTSPGMQKAVQWARRNPMTTGLAVGGLYGAAGGLGRGLGEAMVQKMPGGKAMQRIKMEKAREADSPLATYAAQNPVKASTAIGTGMGALGGVGMAAAATKRVDPLLGALGGLATGVGAYYGIDKYIKHRRAEAKKEAPTPPPKAA